MFSGRNFLRAAAALLCALLGAAAYAADAATDAHVRPLRLGVVNSYGEEITNLYFGRSIESIRKAIAPRALEVSVYGPDTFLDAAIGDQFDMTIASYGLTSIMLRRTGGTRVLTAVSARQPDPYAANGAAIIARADRQDINTFDDLVGKSLAVMSITAFAGWQVPTRCATGRWTSALWPTACWKMRPSWANTTFPTSR